jgi:anti-sigma B factor antagonist
LDGRRCCQPARGGGIRRQVAEYLECDDNARQIVTERTVSRCYNRVVKEALRVDHVAAHIAGAVVLAVSGELDLSTVDIFRAAVRQQVGASRNVVLELSGLGFCDSSGVGALIGLYRAAAAAGACLVVVAPRRQVADVFALSGVDQILGVYLTLTAARAALTAP